MIDTNPWREKMSTELMLRPGFGKLGKPAAVNINSYPVTQFPTKKIYQCDVSYRILRNMPLFYVDSSTGCRGLG